MCKISSLGTLLRFLPLKINPVSYSKCSSKFLVLSIGKEMGLKEGGIAESFMVFVLFGVELFNF